MTKNKVIRYITLFLIGGFLYCCIEVITRGFSHISMLIAGGLAFVLIGNLNKTRKDMSLIGQMFISMIIITAIELVTGLIVNKLMGLNVWDYSNMPYNFQGQICLLFINIWFFLSTFAIIIDDYIRFYFMGEDKPKYKIF